MNTLRPKGDDIAREFYGLMKRAGRLQAPESEAAFEGGDDARGELSEEDLDQAFDKATAEDAIFEALTGMGREATKAGESEGSDSFDRADLISMLRGSDSDESFALDSAMLSGIDEAYNAISKAEDGMTHTASEQRVLDGLQKIAAGLRAKGEGFASDVVLATANSIRGDLKKKAEHRARMIGGLQKIAQEFYAEGEQLAGDMVQVTINKLGGFDDAFKDLDNQLAKGKKAPDKSKYPKTADDIPRVYKEMQAAIKEVGDPFKEMDIRGEYGFVSESKLNGRHVIEFNLQDGGRGEFTFTKGQNKK